MTTQDAAIDSCPHPPEAIQPGPRVPLRWGSSATDVCSLCGMYRLTFRDGGQWQPGPVDTSDEDDDD